MYTLFEQIICHRCVFASVSRTRAPRDAQALRVAPSRAGSHMRAAQRDLAFCRRILFPASLMWSPRNISLEWTNEYFI